MTYTAAIALAEELAQSSEGSLAANKQIGTTRPDATTTCSVRILKRDAKVAVGVAVSVILRAAGVDVVINRTVAPDGWPTPAPDFSFEECKAAAVKALALRPEKVGAADRVSKASSIADLLYTPERIAEDKAADEAHALFVDRNVVRSVSKLSIRRKLRLISKEGKFDEMLDLIPHARTDWNDAIEASVDEIK
jgi:hypothetical protein